MISVITNSLSLKYQLLIEELGRTTGMFLALLKSSNLSGLTFPAKAQLSGKAGFPS